MPLLYSLSDALPPFLYDCYTHIWINVSTQPAQLTQYCLYVLGLTLILDNHLGAHHYWSLIAPLSIHYLPVALYSGLGSCEISLSLHLGITSVVIVHILSEQPYCWDLIGTAFLSYLGNNLTDHFLIYYILWALCLGYTVALSVGAEHHSVKWFLHFD